MAIILFDDFEAGANLRWSASQFAGFSTSIAGMFGRCASMTNGASFDSYFRYNLDATRDEGLVSFALSFATLPDANTRFFSVMNGATHQVALYLNSNGSFSVARDTTVLQTSPIVVTAANIRYRIELGFSINDTTGSFVLKVNGSELLNFTGQDTRNGVDGFNRAMFGTVNTISGSVYYDDVLIDDDKTAFRGDLYGLARVPVSDVSGYSTPSTGANRWATIDELPYSAADYNTFPSTGIDRFGVDDLPDTPDDIYAICINWIGRKTDTGDCDMRSRLYSGAATANGTTRAMNVASQFFQDVHQTDPDTSAAWTAAGFNAIDIGNERTV